MEQRQVIKIFGTTYEFYRISHSWKNAKFQFQHMPDNRNFLEFGFWGVTWLS